MYILCQHVSNEACKTPEVFFKYVLILRISQTLLIDKTFVNIIIKLRHPSILELCVVLLYCWKNLV